MYLVAKQQPAKRYKYGIPAENMQAVNISAKASPYLYASLNIGAVAYCLAYLCVLALEIRQVRNFRHPQGANIKKI